MSELNHLYRRGMRARTLIKALFVGTLLFGASTILTLFHLRKSEGRINDITSEGAGLPEKTFEVRLASIEACSNVSTYHAGGSRSTYVVLEYDSQPILSLHVLTYPPNGLDSDLLHCGLSCVALPWKYVDSALGCDVAGIGLATQD